jgi:hypothetical protein
VEEIAAGLWHWKALRESIGSEVSSYYFAAERLLIDPMVPPEGPTWFAEHGGPSICCSRAATTTATRGSCVTPSAAGCTASATGCTSSRDAARWSRFAFDDELPGGIVAYELDAICADECALHAPAHRALACADGVVRWPDDGPLRFVPDELMDEPERTRAGLRDASRRLLELDFDRLLLAHGDPLVQGGKEELFAFVERA